MAQLVLYATRYDVSLLLNANLDVIVQMQPWFVDDANSVRRTLKCLMSVSK